jgi:hypothetical protein
MLYFYVCHQFLDAPPNITETNLSVDKNLVANLGTSMKMFCNSDGLPYPDTFWFKVGN